MSEERSEGLVERLREIARRLRRRSAWAVDSIEIAADALEEQAATIRALQAEVERVERVERLAVERLAEIRALRAERDATRDANVQLGEAP